jgi:hypothetical protein
MVRHPVQKKYQDREEERTKQEMKGYFCVHLICFAFRRLEKPNCGNAKEKHYSCRYQRVSDRCHGFAIPRSVHNIANVPVLSAPAGRALESFRHGRSVSWYKRGGERWPKGRISGWA